MIIWHRGTQLEQKYSVRLKLDDYTENLAALRGDNALPELTQNLVYIGSSDDMETIDRNTLYSILDKDPKRARAYWFLSVHALDEPNAMNYQVETFGTDYIFRVKLNLGFKNDQRVNIYLRQIVRDQTRGTDTEQIDRTCPLKIGRTSLQDGVIERSRRRFDRAHVAFHHLPHDTFDAVIHGDVLEGNVFLVTQERQLGNQFALELLVARKTQALAKAQNARGRGERDIGKTADGQPDHLVRMSAYICDDIAFRRARAELTLAKPQKQSVCHLKHLR